MSNITGHGKNFCRTEYCKGNCGKPPFRKKKQSVTPLFGSVITFDDGVPTTEHLFGKEKLVKKNVTIVQKDNYEVYDTSPSSIFATYTVDGKQYDVGSMIDEAKSDSPSVDKLRIYSDIKNVFVAISVAGSSFTPPECLMKYVLAANAVVKLSMVKNPNSPLCIISYLKDNDTAEMVRNEASKVYSGLSSNEKKRRENLLSSQNLNTFLSSVLIRRMLKVQN
jgi:hypothetical protein